MMKRKWCWNQLEKYLESNGIKETINETYKGICLL